MIILIEIISFFFSLNDMTSINIDKSNIRIDEEIPCQSMIDDSPKIIRSIRKNQKHFLLYHKSHIDYQQRDVMYRQN